MKVIRWLVDKNFFSGLIGAVLIAIVVPLTVWLATNVRESSNQASYKLCIKVPQTLLQMPFTVRHVRDGAGEPPPGGLSYKSDVRFPNAQSDGRTCQDLSFPRHVGIMFKVYVSYTDIEFDAVKKILEDAGYTDVSIDARPGLKNAWFIIPEFLKITHGNPALKGEIIDNFYLD